MMIRPVYDPVKAGALGITEGGYDAVCEIHSRWGDGWRVPGRREESTCVVEICRGEYYECRGFG